MKKRYSDPARADRNRGCCRDPSEVQSGVPPRPQPGRPEPGLNLKWRGPVGKRPRKHRANGSLLLQHLARIIRNAESARRILGAEQQKAPEKTAIFVRAWRVCARIKE